MKLTSLLTISVLPILALAQANQNGLGTTPSQRYEINATQAYIAIQAAAAKAESILPINIAITTPDGFLKAFYRMDNAFLGSVEIAQKKARTVSLFNGVFTTLGFYNASQPGQSLYGIEETNNGLIVFGGGLPLNVGGYFIGAIGVSGGTVDQDIEIATAGVQALGGVL